MKEMGAMLKVGGKPHLRFNIMKELPNTSAYTDLGVLTPVRPDPWTSVVFNWKQLSTPVQVSGLDMVKTGDDAAIDLLAGFISVAEISMRDAVGGNSVGIYSSAGEDDLTSMTGLQNFFTSTVAAGSVGQLSRASQAAWRHQYQNISNDFSANGVNRLRTIFRQTSYFDVTPDTIVGTGSFMENYERNLTATLSTDMPKPAGSQGMLDAGFQNMAYKGAVMFDDDGCPDNAAYVLNLADYIRLIVREGRDAEIGDFVKSQTKDDLVTYVLTAGNLITTGLRYGGLLANGDTD